MDSSKLPGQPAMPHLGDAMRNNGILHLSYIDKKEDGNNPLGGSLVQRFSPRHWPLYGRQALFFLTFQALGLS